MTRQPTRSLLFAIALAAILLLGFWLRVWQLNAQSLWYDEAVSAQVAQQGVGELARWTADDIQPPLYYLVLAGWTQVAGLSETALRFPSAFFGVLMIALAFVLGKRLFGPAAGLLAALLAAVHPLWVYYSQEARMYTLLTALGMLAGYALLRALAAANEQNGYPKRRLSWWAGFALASIALLYTHYFAVFLLLVFGVYFLIVVLVHRGPHLRRLLLEGIIVAGLIGLAYLPWLPNVLRRFRVDSSYWTGALKLDEALRHTAISFTTGETVLEAQAVPLALAITALALLCLIALVWATRKRSAFHVQRSSLLFVLLYLLVPVVAILALSYRTPKFNPRYLMLASPAFVLLLAGGLALPFSPATRSHSNLWQRIVAGAAIAGVLLVSLYAVRNWFSDPAFTKDDWRGAAAYIRANIQPDEGVVLVSGHALPAWRYYAPDLQPVRLPELETLNVNAVLGLDATETLNSGLAGKRGAWLVQWQANVVDPNGVVPFLLDTAGDAQPQEASFWGLGAPQHYRFVDVVRATADAPGTAFPTELPLTAAYRGQQLNVNFDGQVELVGYSQPSCQQPLCPVYLFWRALKPLDTDLKLTATLFGRYYDDTWSEPLDRRLAAYDYPTFRWQPGEVILSRVDIPAELGTPPGEYRLRLGVYDDATGEALATLDAAGAPEGRWTWLEPIVARELVTDGPGGPPAGSIPVQAAPEIVLHSISADRTQMEPGESLAIDAWWDATAPPPYDYRTLWQWIAPDGAVVSYGSPPSNIDFPTSHWPPGNLVHHRFDAYWTNAEPGHWLMRIGLLDPASTAPDLAFAGETIDLPIEIVPSTHRFEPSGPYTYATMTNFDFLIELLGINAPGEPLTRGSVVPVTVGWHAVQTMDTSYTGFVHLLDQDNRVVAQDDHIPLQGQRPTTTWVSGEVVEDTYTLNLPADLPPGSYRLEVGLYDAGLQGMPRLRTKQGTDSVVIDGFVVE